MSTFETDLLVLLCDADGRLGRYFAVYEVTKKALTPAGQDPSQLNLGAIVTAGGMAGVAMWSIAIPPDVRSLGEFRKAYTQATCRIYTGHQIADTICSRGDVPRLRRLCAKNHRG